MSEFISLYSGSSGNCSVVRTGKSTLSLIWAKGVRTTSAALKAGPEHQRLCGHSVTHEHSDHVKGLSTFLKKNPLPGLRRRIHWIFWTPTASCPSPASCAAFPEGKRTSAISALRPFPPATMYPCVGYRIHTPDDKTMTIATDLGVLTPPVHEALSGCDLVALESNYDLHMLRSGPYPYYLRSRIESQRGHLSNDECSAKLLELIQEGCEKVRALPPLAGEQHPPVGIADRFQHPRRRRCRARIRTALSRPSAEMRSARRWSFKAPGCCPHRVL